MSGNSPYDLFGEGSLHLLRHRYKKGEDVLATDVATMIEGNPELVPEDDVRGLVIKGLRGELTKSRGRKKRDIARMSGERLVLADFAELFPKVRKLRKRMRGQGWKKKPVDHSDMELVHALIARRNGYAVPETVRNIISSFKNRPNSH